MVTFLAAPTFIVVLLFILVMWFGARITSRQACAAIAVLAMVITAIVVMYPKAMGAI